MQASEKVGIKIPQILLPKNHIDLTKWAVIACDQFTSQPEYWQRVASFVADSPSTYKIILPEAWLHSPDLNEKIAQSQQTMQTYLEQEIFDAYEGFVLVERFLGDRTQTGLVVALDLEKYDYNKGSKTLIRATEGTILDRLPPRMQVRRGAPLESPHIMVLYDDPDGIVLSQIMPRKDQLPLVYDFELMEGSGHLTGHLVADEALLDSVVAGLTNLIVPESFKAKYALNQDLAPLLFAMGDGNHSLATAKAIWEELKPNVSMDHPARYALVELVNLHDPSLRFEAIHRVIFNIEDQFMDAMIKHLQPGLSITKLNTLTELSEKVNRNENSKQRFGVIDSHGYKLVELSQPKQNLPVGNLQEFLDTYLSNHSNVKIDYVHGDEVVEQLAKQPGNIGFYLPPITKDSFFKTVILDGALPRKTFSMGHAKDKRFYMECRRIK